MTTEYKTNWEVFKIVNEDIASNVIIKTRSSTVAEKPHISYYLFSSSSSRVGFNVPPNTL